jgi:hypothetical protein
MALTLAAVAAPAASASIEVGDECAANEASGTFTEVPESRASNGRLPLTAPTSGVVTAWKVNSALSEPVTEWMAAFRSTGQEGTFQVIGQSDEETANQGLNVYPARIPVQAGDRFGLVGVGNESPLFCLTGNNEDHTWSLPYSVGPGSTHVFAAGVQVRVPLVAVIEPDRDGDGYGDETQDKCPQSAAYQGECPRVSLGIFPILGKDSVTLLVTSNLATGVRVSQVTKGRSLRGGIRVGAGRYPTPVTMPAAPGTITRFRFHFYKPMREKLKALSPHKSVLLKFTVSAPNLVGSPTSETVLVKVHGQKKPPGKR